VVRFLVVYETPPDPAFERHSRDVHIVGLEDLR